MEDQLRIEIIVKTLVREIQFEQWLKTLFFTSDYLLTSYDLTYQESFYIKFYELLNDGFNYANEVLLALEITDNEKKKKFYSTLIKGIANIKSLLSEIELDYIEYRRHTACHIFQDSYEHIKDSYEIRSTRKNKPLDDINVNLKKLIKKHGSDRDIDDYINLKLQKELTNLYTELK